MEQRIQPILSGSKTVAVVGLSDKRDRPSHGVAKYLQERGYRVIPVNPLVTEVLGEKAYKSLAEIPERVDLVDVFRKSADVSKVAEEAVRIGARFFWMQEGVESDRACEILDAAGIPWVMDRCVKKELGKRGK
jgi:predicted CoA-binding protein